MLKRETEENASLSSRGQRLEGLFYRNSVREAKKECEKIRKYDKEKNECDRIYNK
jgi:hypothetical protein